VEEYGAAAAKAAGYADRTAMITVTAGDFAPIEVVVTQSAPEEVTLTTDPVELVFEAGVLTEIATIETNADDVTVTIPVEFGWIYNAVEISNIVSVTVGEYVGTENRTGYVLISADGLEEDYRLNITQHPVVPLDLSGEWTYTGLRWGSGKYEEVSGNLTAVYDGEKGYYKFTDIAEYFMYGPSQSIGNGGFALRVTDDNAVTFTQFDEKLEMYSDALFMFIYFERYSFRNYVKYIDQTSKSDSGTPAIAYGTGIELSAGDGGNTITFPVSQKVGSDTFDCVFGFGMVSCEVGSDDMEFLINNPGPIDPPYAELSDIISNAALFNRLVLTRVE
jgi:hypothetical protein